MLSRFVFIALVIVAVYYSEPQKVTNSQNSIIDSIGSIPHQVTPSSVNAPACSKRQSTTKYYATERTDPTIEIVNYSPVRVDFAFENYCVSYLAEFGSIKILKYFSKYTTSVYSLEPNHAITVTFGPFEGHEFAGVNTIQLLNSNVAYYMLLVDEIDDNLNNTNTQCSIAPMVDGLGNHLLKVSGKDKKIVISEVIKQ